MLNKDIYAIYTENDDRSGTTKELFFSFEEAKENRFKYGNWFRPNGDVWIDLYKAEKLFYPSHRWHILPDGTIEYEHKYNF